MRTQFLPSCAVLVLALAACATPPGRTAKNDAAAASAGAAVPESNSATFDCEGLAISAVFFPDRARVTVSDRTLELTSRITGSGAKYADEAGNMLWTRGMDEGMLTLAGEDEHRDCVAR